MTGYLGELRKKVGHAPIITSAVVVLIYQDGKVLLQKRTDNGKWALHGGSMEIGETLKEAAVREVQEEIHITPRKLELFGIYSGKKMHLIYPNQDEVYAIDHVFFCTEYEGEPEIDQDEVSKVQWFDKDKLPSEQEIMHTDYHVLKQLDQFLENKIPIVE